MACAIFIFIAYQRNLKATVYGGSTLIILEHSDSITDLKRSEACVKNPMQNVGLKPEYVRSCLHLLTVRCGWTLPGRAEYSNVRVN